MVLPIVIYGDPVLRTEGAPVTEVTQEIRDLAADMIETMHDADGVGLAAQQVGHALQIAVIDVSHAPDLQTYFRVDGREAALKDWMPLVFTNPKLDFGREKAAEPEGCLSFPGLRYRVLRPVEVKAELTLLDGRKILLEADGLLARAIQHETDHLNGRLFIDRISAADKLTLKRKLNDMYADLEEEERLLRKELRKRAREEAAARGEG